jgi:excisionase family DNA binding protein
MTEVDESCFLWTKIMQPRRYLSPQQVAEALGVSVTTMKRWVDEGRLPAQRTAGGHRRILLCDVLRLVREGNWPHIDLTLLTGPLPVAEGLAAGQWAVCFHEALMAGDSERAGSLLQDASGAGLRIEELADGIVAPVLAHIGQDWADGSLDVYQEHRATWTCLMALQSLRQRLEIPGRDRPLAVGGGPEGDPYLLANGLIELLLLENGWRVVNLGPDTPLPAMQGALGELRPHLVWLSCGRVADVESFLGGYRELVAEARRLDVAVAVGGRALGALRTSLACDCSGESLAVLADFVRGLDAPLRRCRRVESGIGGSIEEHRPAAGSLPAGANP